MRGRWFVFLFEMKQGSIVSINLLRWNQSWNTMSASCLTELCVTPPIISLPREEGWVQYGIRPFSLLLDQICRRRKHSYGCWRRLLKLCNIQNEGQPCKRNSLTSWCCAALTLALVLLGSELRDSSALARATAAPFLLWNYFTPEKEAWSFGSSLFLSS